MTIQHTFRELFVVPKDQARLLGQYYVNLQVNYDSIRAENNNPTQGITDKIEVLLAKDPALRTWNKAYEIEQHLIRLCSEAALEVELRRRLVEFGHHFSEEAYNHYRNEIEAISSSEKMTEQKRSILLRMITELQWFYTKRAELRDYGLITRLRTGLIFLIAFLLFLCSLVYCVFVNITETQDSVLIIATTSGFLGASFSLLTSLKAQLASCTMEELKVLHRISYIVIRTFIGVGAALILYFFMGLCS